MYAVAALHQCGPSTLTRPVHFLLSLTRLQTKEGRAIGFVQVRDSGAPTNWQLRPTDAAAGAVFADAIRHALLEADRKERLDQLPVSTEPRALLPCEHGLMAHRVGASALPPHRPWSASFC